jgi:hypothetical protein
MRRLALAVAFIAVPSLALAANVPIKASYGSKEGCIYAKTGDSSGADDFFLLTKESVTTSTAQCTFGKLVSNTKGKIKAHAKCETEGEDGGDEIVTLTPVGASAYTVDFEDGSHWAAVKQCK